MGPVEAMVRRIIDVCAFECDTPCGEEAALLWLAEFAMEEYCECRAAWSTAAGDLMYNIRAEREEAK